MPNMTKNLGAVTAYRYAVNGGYTGTEEEFQAALGQASVALDQIENLSAVAITLTPGSAATASYADGVLTIGVPEGVQGIKGDTGDTGNGIASVMLNQDYTLTLNYTDGSHVTLGSIRGEKGEQGEHGLKGETGDTGTTFTPDVSENGVISWTNDGGLPNPDDVDLVATAGRVLVVNVPGTDPVITANANARYVCGEVSTVSFTPPASGIAELIFTSGSSVAVLTLPGTVRMPDWFMVEPNRTYEISIMDGVFGAVMSWDLT